MRYLHRKHLHTNLQPLRDVFPSIPVIANRFQQLTVLLYCPLALLRRKDFRWFVCLHVDNHQWTIDLKSVDTTRYLSPLPFGTESKRIDWFNQHKEMEPNRFRSHAFSRLSLFLWNELYLMRSVQQWIQKGRGMRRRNWRQTGSELCDVEMKCMACWTIIGDAFVWFCSLSRIHHNPCDYSVVIMCFPIPTICLIHSPNSIPDYPSFLPCSFSFTFIPFLTSPHSQPTHKPLNLWLGVSCLKSASQVRNNSILFFLFHDSHSSNSFTMQEQREEMEIERDVRTSSLPPKTRITDQPP